MKCKSIVLIVVLFILMILLATCSESNIKLEYTGSKQTIVNFEDPGLEEAFREAINKPSGDIYVSELKEVKTLKAEFHKIKFLKGIEYCSSLEALDLSYNQISDLRPLAGLNSLELLFLDNNQIMDLSPLAGLTSLVDLFLDYNPLNKDSKTNTIPLLEKNGVNVFY